MEVMKNVFRLQTVIPGNGPGMLNSYLFKTEQGCLLVDTGWNRKESEDDLVGQLHEIGAKLGDLRLIVITHAHPDHIGLMHRLASQTGATLVIHELEQAGLVTRAENYSILVDEMSAWLEVHDMPGDPHRFFDSSSLVSLGLLPIEMPTRIVHGGESISIGDFKFEILWTPGHAPGHICLYEIDRKILVSGDHVLPNTTPNVSMYTEVMGNPLASYLDSLMKIRSLETNLILPSHGEPFNDLSGRVDAIINHHEERLCVMKSILARGEMTARMVAEVSPWVDGTVAWNNLASFARRMALTETISHLELLLYRNEASRTFRDDRYWYSPV